MSVRRIVRTAALMVGLCSAILFGQTRPAFSSAPGVHEFPVTMRQNVVAGKTPAGTKVEARLEVATLVNGEVIPAGARFSGEVVESVAKSATDPSRLAIRMDSVRWKKRSASIKVYLTASYYPVRMAMDEPGDEPLMVPTRTRRRRGGPTNPDPSTSQPFPDSPASNSNNVSNAAPAPASWNVSDNRVLLKDVEAMRHGDGTIGLISSRLNIKLDKSTTYVLATSDVSPRR